MKRTQVTSPAVPALVSSRQAAEPHSAPQSAWESFDRELSRQLEQFEHDHPGWLTPKSLGENRQG